MTFATNKDWPEDLYNIFKIRLEQRDADAETSYLGPYNALLHHCFGDSFDYFVAPSHALSRAPYENCDTNRSDFLAHVAVFNLERKPVLIVDIQAEYWSKHPYQRERADELMRRRYNDLLDQCPIPDLYGLSLLGTSLRIYRGNVATREIEPAYQGHTDTNRILPRNFLEGLWDIDILSQDGFNRMKEIVSYIRANSA